jgi:hypothetical protein
MLDFDHIWIVATLKKFKNGEFDNFCNSIKIKSKK